MHGGKVSQTAGSRIPKRISVRTAIQVLQVFWPDFIEVNGCIFAAFQCSGGATTAHPEGRTEMESFVNHTHVFDEFRNKATLRSGKLVPGDLEGVVETYDIAHPDFIAACELGIQMARMWAGSSPAVPASSSATAVPGTAAYSASVPIYTSSPGDSSIGMNIAALALDGNKLLLDPNRDVNETASIVLDAKRGGGKSGVMILGGGSPKNFMLQTEPQIQEVLGIDEKGHDYFLQITDARPDTGGLSGATPAEAVSWGKIDPDRLPDAVVCYLDSTVALPLLTSYAFAKHRPRTLKRLFDRREAMMSKLQKEYEKSSSQAPTIDHTDSKLPQHR
jgi:hypothetical protein